MPCKRGDPVEVCIIGGYYRQSYTLHDRHMEGVTR